MKPFNRTRALATKRPAVVSLSLVMITSLLAACGSTSTPVSTSAPTSTRANNGSGGFSCSISGTSCQSHRTSTVVLNWFAEPEHGGNFAALAKGYYKDAGFDMTFMPGGPSVSSTQIVASGKAQFGMANGDDILVARQEGIPVVAIATSMQKSPQALFYHKDSGVKDFADLNGHKVYVASTASFWQFIKNKYKLDKRARNEIYRSISELCK